jgi:transcriptional regulator with XRE-family HTH domain
MANLVGQKCTRAMISSFENAGIFPSAQILLRIEEISTVPIYKLIKEDLNLSQIPIQPMANYSTLQHQATGTNDSEAVKTYDSIPSRSKKERGTTSLDMEIRMELLEEQMEEMRGILRLILKQMQ